MERDNLIRDAYFFENTILSDMWDDWMGFKDVDLVQAKMILLERVYKRNNLSEYNTATQIINTKQ